MNESLNMHKAKLGDLIVLLRCEEFKVLGPVARDGSVTLTKCSEFPIHRLASVNRRGLGATGWGRAMQARSSA
jgi:hypothetical protein